MDRIAVELYSRELLRVRKAAEDLIDSIIKDASHLDFERTGPNTALNFSRQAQELACVLTRLSTLKEWEFTVREDHT